MIERFQIAEFRVLDSNFIAQRQSRYKRGGYEKPTIIHARSGASVPWDKPFEWTDDFGCERSVESGRVLLWIADRRCKRKDFSKRA